MLDPIKQEIRDVREALGALTGKPRRAAYLALKAASNAQRRAKRRLPTEHAHRISELKKVSLLPPLSRALDAGLTEAELRQIRNKLKAQRKRHRR